MTEWPSIGGSMKEIGEEFQSNIPHVMLGKEGFSMTNSQKPKQFPTRDVKTPQNPPNPQKNTLPEPPSDDFIDKIRKWGLIILCAAAIGFAIYRLFA